MNPFITLTRINRGGNVYINVNHIVAFHQKTFSDSPQKYTYVLIAGGSGCSREVEETPEQIVKMINKALLTIPYANIKGA